MALTQKRTPIHKRTRVRQGVAEGSSGTNTRRKKKRTADTPPVSSAAKPNRPQVATRPPAMPSEQNIGGIISADYARLFVLEFSGLAGQISIVSRALCFGEVSPLLAEEIRSMSALLQEEISLITHLSTHLQGGPLHPSVTRESLAGLRRTIARAATLVLHWQVHLSQEISTLHLLSSGSDSVGISVRLITLREVWAETDPSVRTLAAIYEQIISESVNANLFRLVNAIIPQDSPLRSCAIPVRQERRQGPKFVGVGGGGRSAQPHASRGS